jgi:pectinesterase
VDHRIHKTVQEAFNAVPMSNNQLLEIFIKNGVYKEKLHLDSGKNNVVIIGEDPVQTILSYDDHTGTIAPDGSVINTMTSQTLYIKADDVKIQNITIENTAGFTAGQAVAVRVQGDRIFFLGCRILGFQDTLFTSGENSRQYYQNCFIQGSTDFIFGSSTALFDGCIIRSKKNSHVTAASTPKEHSFGYVFRKCWLISDTGLNKVSLGRPWRPYASVTYIECKIESHILPAGWDNWKNPENEKPFVILSIKILAPALIHCKGNMVSPVIRRGSKKVHYGKHPGNWRPYGTSYVTPATPWLFQGKAPYEHR